MSSNVTLLLNLWSIFRWDRESMFFYQFPYFVLFIPFSNSLVTDKHFKLNSESSMKKADTRDQKTNVTDRGIKGYIQIFFSPHREESKTAFSFLRVEKRPNELQIKQKIKQKNQHTLTRRYNLRSHLGKQPCMSIHFQFLYHMVLLGIEIDILNYSISS